MSDSQSPPRWNRSPLRWTGGKFHLRRTLSDLTSLSGRTSIIDPFCGGFGALLALDPPNFCASDVNRELVNFYNHCRDFGNDILDAMESQDDTEEAYYRVRASRPGDAFDQAVRFLYLNRTGYGGLFRVNRSGVFNVPYGGGGRMLPVDLRDRVLTLGKVLQRGSLQSQDFSSALSGDHSHALILLDPPYTIAGDAPFGRYSASSFAIDDHRTLARLVRRQCADGAAVIATLPNAQPIMDLYQDWWFAPIANGEKARNQEMVLVNWAVPGAVRVTDPHAHGSAPH